MKGPRDWSEALAAVAVASLCAWGLLVHTDDTDAGLYRTVVRHMAEDGAWFDLRYLPTAHPRFREHLPFGLWPYALVQRWSDSAPPALAFLASLATLALLAKTRPLAALFLGTTPAFFVHSALLRLDNLLVLVTTAAALVWVETTSHLRRWVVMGVASAAAVAIKGPFGLVPLVATAACWPLAGQAPGPRRFPWGNALGLIALCAASTAGPLAFLFSDRLAGGTWWSGYVESQLVASAQGTRTDGSTSLVYPFVAVAGRFWPWLPLAAVALARSVSRPDLRRRGASVLLMLAILCIPSRKVWNHTLVVFPFLCLWVAEAVEPLVERWPLKSWRWLSGAFAAAALLALGGGAFTERCILPPTFAAYLAAHPQARIAVVSTAHTSVWKPLATMAGEYRLTPRLEHSLDAAWQEGAEAALVWGEQASSPSGWELLLAPSP